MFSFQPAAFIGDERRWHEDYRDVTGGQVWAQIERGVGTTLDYHLFEHGDVRCNRVAYGFWAGDRWYPLLDGADPRDLAVRDAFLRYFGPVNFIGTPVALLAVRVALIIARHPRIALLAAGWAASARSPRSQIRRDMRDGSSPAAVLVTHRYVCAGRLGPTRLPRTLPAGIPRPASESQGWSCRLRAVPGRVRAPWTCKARPVRSRAR
jgi:hypothetical protein